VQSPSQPFVFDATGDSDARPTTLQGVLSRSLGRASERFPPRGGYIAPLGGRLGDAEVGGLRLRVDALF
jgi:hypothetical protein